MQNALVLFEEYKQLELKCEVHYLRLPTVWLTKYVRTGRIDGRKILTNLPDKYFFYVTKFDRQFKKLNEHVPQEVQNFDFDFDLFSKFDVTVPVSRSSKLDYSKVKIRKWLKSG